MTLHIISFDLPYPPNYGGVIDVYYKIKALKQQGVAVILHIFLYGEKQHLSPNDTPLSTFCQAVYCYPRQSFWVNNWLKYPYIVGSRRHIDLWRNLCADRHPILFEGLHTCAYLPQMVAQGRLCMVRMHNIESDYYAHLYRSEHHWAKKAYYGIESHLLKRYEPVLHHANAIFAISPADAQHLIGKYGHAQYLPAFHAHERVISQVGTGNYALYHGNLSVQENDRAALFLLNEVYAGDEILPFPLVIAGRNPSAALVAAAKGRENVLLVANPSAEAMKKWVTDAHVHLLPTFQPTGIKLKLLETLFCGRFCIANANMVANTGLENLCYVANTPRAFREIIGHIANLPFSDTMSRDRAMVLENIFSNQKGAIQIIETAFCQLIN